MTGNLLLESFFDGLQEAQNTNLNSGINGAASGKACAGRAGVAVIRDSHRTPCFRRTLHL